MIEIEAAADDEKIRGRVHLHIDRRVKSRGIYVRLFGAEEVRIVDRVDKKLRKAKNIIIDEIRKIKDKGELFGSYTLSFEFKLPENRLPTYRGVYVNIFYKVATWIDIPFRFDIKAEKEIEILPKCSMPYKLRKSFLNKAVFRRGEIIRGRIEGRSRVKLVCVESADTKHVSAKIAVYEKEVDVLSGGFSIKIPNDAPFSYAGKLSSVAWYLVVGGEHIPIAVLPHSCEELIF